MKNEEPIIRSAITYVIEGNITDEQFAPIEKHCINPVDSRAIGMEKPQTLVQKFDEPDDVKVLMDLQIWRRLILESCILHSILP